MDASSTSLPSAEILGQVNESGNESREPELRQSDLPDTDSLKAVDVGDAMLPERSPAVPVEGEALVSPRSSGPKVVFFAYFFVICSLGCCLYACMRLSLISSIILWQA